MRISIIGLGKLGAVMAALYASRGHDVIGIDVNKEYVNKINRRIAPVQETGLQNLLELLRDNTLKATTDYKEACTTEISFIIVPTPSMEDDRFTNEYANKALESLALACKGKSTYHLFVITSTVMPDSCDKVFIPILEKGLGLAVNDRWGLCYNPEFIALGSVIRDMENPDSILIGESSKLAGDKLGAFYYNFHSNNNKMPPIKRMSLWEAEVAKIALNCCLTNKISLANSIARICEKGGDASNVLGFIGLDSRIGSKFLGAGLGYAGPCLPRDTKALMAFAGKNNTLLQQAADQTNDDQIDYILSKIMGFLNDGDTVAMLGLTYKTNTPLVYESRAIILVQKLLTKGIHVKVYDPQGLGEAEKILGKSVEYCGSAVDCLIQAVLCVIGMGWDEYKQISPDAFNKWMRKPVIYDCWRIYDKSVFANTGIEYHAFGVL